MLEGAAFWGLDESIETKICAQVDSHGSTHLPPRSRLIRWTRIIRIVQVSTISSASLDAVDDRNDDCDWNEHNYLDQKANLLLEQKHADEHQVFPR